MSVIDQQGQGGRGGGEIAAECDQPNHAAMLLTGSVLWPGQAPSEERLQLGPVGFGHGAEIVADSPEDALKVHDAPDTLLTASG